MLSISEHRTILTKRMVMRSKMENPETLATLGTQDEEKQNKNTTQYVLDTTILKQTQTT